MTIQQREQLRRSRLARFVAKSIQQTEKDVWARRCKSDRAIQLARTDRATAPRVILPTKTEPTCAEPTNTNGRDFHAAKTVGLRSGKKGYRFPKAGCRSMAKPIRRKELLDSGLPTELVDCIMKEQASRIRIRNAVTIVRDEDGKRVAIVPNKVTRIARMLDISLREALAHPFMSENFELA